MGIGVSILLLAIGAILTWAVEVNNSNGFNINTIGVILMFAGGLGLLVSLIWAAGWGNTHHEERITVDRHDHHDEHPTNPF